MAQSDQNDRPGYAGREIRAEHIPMSTTDPPHNPQPLGPVLGVDDPQMASTDWQVAEDGFESTPWNGFNDIRGEDTIRFGTLSLLLFPPDSHVRQKATDILVSPFTEPAILLLIITQAVVLGCESIIDKDKPRHGWGTVSDWILFSLFIIFSIEITCRIVASGLLFDSFDPAFTKMNTPGTFEEQQRLQLARRAFLRHSFNRLDFVAVSSFWIHFILSITFVEPTYHIYIFRMLSCLRIVRLLALTQESALMLRLWKRVSPYLLRSSLLLLFFTTLFAAIGVQCFNSSLRRHCVWLDPVDPNNLKLSYRNEFQFCGGYLDNETGAALPWVIGASPEVLESLRPGAEQHGGYTCPRGSICLLQTNPYNNTLNFDNILNSLEIVFVTMGGASFSNLMYYTIHSESLVAALFFAAAVICLKLWLANLLIITSARVMEIGDRDRVDNTLAKEPLEPDGEGSSTLISEPQAHRQIPGGWMEMLSFLDRFSQKWSLFCVALIVYDLITQCFWANSMSTSPKHWVNASEVLVTFLLDVEFFMRTFAAINRTYRADGKLHTSPLGAFDGFLALATTITAILLLAHQLSPSQHAGLTIFRLLRVYRVFLVTPIIGTLIREFLPAGRRIFNFVIFVAILAFSVSVFVTQLVKGGIPTMSSTREPIKISFYDLPNSFQGIFQILSRDQWADTLFSSTAYTRAFKTDWILAIALTVWYLLALFMLMPLFLSILKQANSIDDNAKRREQLNVYSKEKEVLRPITKISSRILSLLPGYKSLSQLTGWTSTDVLFPEPEHAELLAARYKSYPEPPAADIDIYESDTSSLSNTVGYLPWEKVFRKVNELFGTFSSNPFHSEFTPESPEDLASHSITLSDARKMAQVEYIDQHPTYNNTLFIFRPRNIIRRLCQTLVSSRSHQKRYDGVEPNKTAKLCFSATIFSVMVVATTLCCIATPLYQANYLQEHGYSPRAWFVWTDILFSAILSLEAVIHIIADGFFWTPNAYYRNLWGLVDGAVLISMWMNVVSALLTKGQIPRSIAVFKCLRVIRLLTVSDSARYTIRSVFFTGLTRTLTAAAFVACFLIPFAIYGLSLFSNQLVACNDNSGPISNLQQCFGEWNSTPFNSTWPLLAPRVASNPYFNFDSFGASVFTVFRIATQSGWVDVSYAVQAIAGPGLQPSPFASKGYGFLLIFFSLFTTMFVLFLFMAIFIRNYAEKAGSGFLVEDQLAWLRLRKRIYELVPMKPSYRRKGLHRHFPDILNLETKWGKPITLILLVHLGLLWIQFYSEPLWWAQTRNCFFLLISILYVFESVFQTPYDIKDTFWGLVWKVPSFSLALGMFITSILAITFRGSLGTKLGHSQTFFLIANTIQLIPRIRILLETFHKASNTFAALMDLVILWMTALLAFSIAMNQAFGLTRFGPMQDTIVNFRSIPHSAVLLFRLSFGDGWNKIMEDFANIKSPLCVQSPTVLEDECGSRAWARLLFISWNIISMLLFTSILAGLIYERCIYNIGYLTILDSSELDKFREMWREVDPEGTGFIDDTGLKRLLGTLTGIFEMRVHRAEDSVHQILRDLQHDGVEEGAKFVEKMNRRLSHLDIELIRARRHKLATFVALAEATRDPERGFSMSKVLELIAYSNIILPKESLMIDAYIAHQAALNEAEELLTKRTIARYLETVYLSRKFRKYLQVQSLRAMEIPPSTPESPAIMRGENNPSTHTPLQSYPSPSWQGSQRGSIDDTSQNNNHIANTNENNPKVSSEQTGTMMGDSIWVETIQLSRTTRFVGESNRFV